MGSCDHRPEARRGASSRSTDCARTTPVRSPDIRQEWSFLAARGRRDRAGAAGRDHGLGASAERIGRALARSRGTDAWLSGERASNAGLGALEAAFGLAVSGQGWSIESLPGAPVTLRRDAAAFELHDAFDRLALGRMSAVAWRQWCGDLGVSGIGLSPAKT
jgi:hypothetical protein